MEYRNERLSHLFRDKLSRFIQEEIELDDVMITVTEVEVSQKKDRAKVLVSVLPNEYEKPVIKELERLAKRFSYQLMKQTRIRLAPQLVFKLDRGFANAVAVEQALAELDIPPEEDEG